MSNIALIRATKMMERLRIVGVLQDFTDTALGNGEMEIAGRLAEIITFVNVPEDGVEEVEVVREAPAELPEVQLNTDEQDAERLLRAHPRMRSAAEDFLRD